LILRIILLQQWLHERAAAGAGGGEISAAGGLYSTVFGFCCTAGLSCWLIISIYLPPPVTSPGYITGWMDGG